MFGFLKSDPLFQALPSHAAMVINMLQTSLAAGTNDTYASMWNSVLRTVSTITNAGASWDPTQDPQKEEAWLIWAADQAMRGVSAEAMSKYRFGIQDTLRGLGVEVDFKKFHLLDRFIFSWRRRCNMASAVLGMQDKEAMTPQVALECKPHMDATT